MDSPQVWAAYIGGAFALIGGLLTWLNAHIKHRQEEQRFEFERRIELLRFGHESTKWSLELHSGLEAELHKMRLLHYPPIFAALTVLSGYKLPNLSEDQALKLAEQLNGWGYQEAVLCMLPDTRQSIFDLRDELMKFAKGQVEAGQIQHGPRTTLIESMRRDLNHGDSYYRNFDETLISSIQKAVRASAGMPPA